MKHSVSAMDTKYDAGQLQRRLNFSQQQLARLAPGSSKLVGPSGSLAPRVVASRLVDDAAARKTQQLRA